MITLRMFRKKADIARRIGNATLEDGSTLHCLPHFGGEAWSLRDKYGNTIETGDSPEDFYYLFE